MKKYNFLLTILFVYFATILSSCGDTSTSPPPTGNKGDSDEIAQKNVMAYQLSYIRSLQSESGAIRDNESVASKITPYFAHFAVMALMKEPTSQNIDIVKKYIQWYLSKLNGKTNSVTGAAEVEGSVYDYFGVSETTKGTYDSVDSYAATFLDILNEFANLSEENKSWLVQYKDKISLVLSAMIATIDTEFNKMPGVFSPDNNNYLSVAHLNYDVKYLMDNCEVNSGLKSAKWLKDNNLLDCSHDLSEILAKNTNSIETVLWNNSDYKWMEGTSVTTNWTVFYPDATAQLYAGLFQVIDPASEKANKMYTKFNKSYPSWSIGFAYNSFPWTIIAYASATINDAKRCNAYIKHVNSLNIMGKQKENWYSGEAGCLVLAINRIKNPIVKEYVPIN